MHHQGYRDDAARAAARSQTNPAHQAKAANPTPTTPAASCQNVLEVSSYSPVSAKRSALADMTAVTQGWGQDAVTGTTSITEAATK